jgi:hypothetical protein
MLASDAPSQDPIDLAILAAAGTHDIDPAGWKRLQLVPFEPASKLSEAILSQGAERWRAIKGATQAVASRVKTAVVGKSGGADYLLKRVTFSGPGCSVTCDFLPCRDSCQSC